MLNQQNTEPRLNNQTKVILIFISTLARDEEKYDV
jgi:hypothetical protein